MTYTWFYIFNHTEFLATGLVSRMYNLVLEGLGEKAVLVTKGNYTSILYDDVFLTLDLHDHNPFEFEDYAVYKDDDENVWVGIGVTE